MKPLMFIDHHGSIIPEDSAESATASIEGDNFDNYRSTTTNKHIISDKEKSLSDKNFYNFSLQNSGEMLKEEKNFDQLFQPQL